MKKVFCFLGMFVVFCSANAATMCVPDLSQMTTFCDYVSHTENTWTANCNGIEISGIAINSYQEGTNDWISSLDYKAVNADSLSGYGGGGVGYYRCIVMHPFVMPFGQSIYFGYAWCVSQFNKCFDSAAEACATFFIPSCAFSECHYKLADFGLSGSFGGSS